MCTKDEIYAMILLKVKFCRIRRVSIFENNSQNNSGWGVAIVVIIFIIGIIIFIFSMGGSSSDDRPSKYEMDLYDAYDKVQSGEPLTKDEQRAWDDFKEWEEKNY